jgi:hypothetical protein
MPGKWAEVIIITPRVYEVKENGIGHAAYEIERTLAALEKQISLPMALRDQRAAINALVIRAYAEAWAEDAEDFSNSSQNLASGTSTAPRPILPLSPVGPSNRTLSPSTGAQISNTGTSLSSSQPIANLEPGGGVNFDAVISPTTTAQGGNRQPTKITSANISQYAGNVDVSAIQGKNGEIWRMFDRDQLDPQTGRLVQISQLVSTKDELRDPKFLAGTKQDPRQNAADAMGRSLDGAPRNTKGRAPLDVYAGSDGTFTIIDGNATAQAAMLAGWNVLPVNVRPKPVLASAVGTDDLFGGLLNDYAQKLPAKAKRSKAEAKKIVAQEIPALANNPAALDDIFAWAQTTPANENQNSQPDTSAAQSNGGRAFEQSESDDLGSLFGNPGPAPTGSNAGGSVADGNGNVANDPATTGDSLAPGGKAESLGEGERPAGDAGSRPFGDAAGSLSVDVPGSPDARVRRVDARANAESKRLARIARSESLAPEAQNHRILPGDTIVPRGTKTRLTANVAAIKIIKRLEAEQRKATSPSGKECQNLEKPRSDLKRSLELS